MTKICECVWWRSLNKSSRKKIQKLLSGKEDVYYALKSNIP